MTASGRGGPDGFGSGPAGRARGLVALLGWDWWDAIRSLEAEDDAALMAFRDILSVDGGLEEPGWVKERAALGARAAASLLAQRATEAGRWADDGGSSWP